jgi:hypothetical protein
VKEEHSIQKHFIGYWIFQLGNEIKLWIAINENHSLELWSSKSADCERRT